MKETAESPEVAAILAELAGLTSAIHATWAGYDNVALSGETMLEWRDRLARCAELVAEFGWRADSDRAALAGAQAAREWLRGALFAVTKADDLEEAVMIANAALAPQPAEKQAPNRAESGPGRPEAPKRATGAGVPATGRKTEGIER
jgi:uncharacterized protein YukE